MLEAKAKPRVDPALVARSLRPRQDGRPSISVVAVVSDADDSSAKLRDLGERSSRWQRLGVDLIIVCANRQSTAATLLATGGGARLLYGPPGATDAQLRGFGLAAATGDVIMMIDDSGTADDGWIDHLSAFNGPAASDAEYSRPRS